jgi:hypothetical protein
MIDRSRISLRSTLTPLLHIINTRILQRQGCRLLVYILVVIRTRSKLLRRLYILSPLDHCPNRLLSLFESLLCSLLDIHPLPLLLHPLVLLLLVSQSRALGNFLSDFLILLFIFVRQKLATFFFVQFYFFDQISTLLRFFPVIGLIFVDCLQMIGWDGVSET